MSDRFCMLRAGVYTSDRFRAALSVVLAYAVYLPSAKCFVLLPLLSQVIPFPCLCNLKLGPPVRSLCTCYEISNAS